MADQEQAFREPIDIEGVGPVEFPASMTDAQVNAAATRLYQQATHKKQPPVTSWVQFSRLPDPDGAFALSEIAEENPKAAAAGAMAGLAIPAAPAAAGLATRAAAAIADVVSPEIVGVFSPRIAHGLRLAQKLTEAAKKAAPVVADTASKVDIKATDVSRIKQLIQSGMSQGEAVRQVLNARVKAGR